MSDKDCSIIEARLCYAYSVVNKYELSSQGRIDIYVATLESMLTYLELEGMAITEKEARTVFEDLRLRNRLYTLGPYVVATVSSLGHSARPSDLLSREEKASVFDEMSKLKDIMSISSKLDRIIELLERQHAE